MEFGFKQQKVTDKGSRVLCIEQIRWIHAVVVCYFTPLKERSLLCIIMNCSCCSRSREKFSWQQFNPDRKLYSEHSGVHLHPAAFNITMLTISVWFISTCLLLLLVYRLRVGWRHEYTFNKRCTTYRLHNIFFRSSLSESCIPLYFYHAALHLSVCLSVYKNG